jgi:hypothetical protein
MRTHGHIHTLGTSGSSWAAACERDKKKKRRQQPTACIVCVLLLVICAGLFAETTLGEEAALRNASKQHTKKYVTEKRDAS